MKNRFRRKFVNNRRVVNPLRIDPTRTTMLRKQFIARLRRQFARIGLAMYDLIVREDALGLRERRRTIAQLMVGNAFCPTGEGGGVDPSCGKESGGLSDDSLVIAEKYKNEQMSHGPMKEYMESRGLTLDDYKSANELLYQHNISSGGQSEKDLVDAWKSNSNIGKALRALSDVNEWQVENKQLQREDKDWGMLSKNLEKMRDYMEGREVSPTLERHKELYEAMKNGEKIFYRKGPLDKQVISTTTDPSGATSGTSRFKPDRFMTFKEMKGQGYRLVAGARGMIGVTSSQEQEYVWIKPGLTTNQRWRFETDPEKLKKFQEWLRRQLKLTVLSATDEELWDRYMMEGYKKGAGRAFDDVRVAERAKYGAADKLDFYQGSREQFLKSAFGRPESAAKVKLVAERAYDELEGMTNDMSLKLGRILADGLTTGSNPVEIARTMSVQLGLSRNRAETIARTEIIRAHAEGQLNAMSDLGVEEIGVMVEWSTAGDDRVCEVCSPMEGVVLRIEEAKGMIPRHPNCRCAFIPANVGESTSDQKRGKARVEKAVKVSAERANSDGFDTNVPVSKTRPQSVLNSTWNAFCPTGPGGGVDPTCSPGEAGGGSVSMPSPSTLTKVKDLPGSTGPVLMKDEAGKQYVVKKGKSPEHLKNEDAADAIYRAAGVKVKDSAIVDGVKVAEYMTDATPLDAHIAIGNDKHGVYEKIGNHFVMDALMANHDVIGMSMDNIMVTKGGDVVRIDNGGAMKYRAQGAEKPGKLWGPEVIQLESMRDPAKNPQAAKVFAHLTDAVITDQIKDVVGKRDKIIAAAKAAGVDHSVLEKRLDYLEAKVKDGKQYESKAKPVAPPPSAAKPWSQISTLPSTATASDKPLGTGKQLADALKAKFSGHNYTKLYLQKIEALNPQGIHGGTVVIPHTSIKFTDKDSVVKAKAKQAEVVNHLKEMLPAGTVIKTKGAMSAKAAGVTKTFGSGEQFVGTFTTTKSTGAAFKASAEHASQSDPAHEGKWAKVESGHVGEAPKQMYDSAAHEKWKESLSSKERVAISLWKGSSTGIRQAVTEGFPSHLWLSEAAKHLMSALEKAAPHEGRLYRGIHGEYADGIAKQIIAAGVGGTWSDPAPHCMSLKQSTGQKFSYGRTLFRVYAKTARPIHREDGHASEEEVVGMPKTVYRIAGIHKSVLVKNHGGSSGMVEHVIDLVEE